MEHTNGRNNYSLYFGDNQFLSIANRVFEKLVMPTLVIEIYLRCDGVYQATLTNYERGWSGSGFCDKGLEVVYVTKVYPKPIEALRDVREHAAEYFTDYTLERDKGIRRLPSNNKNKATEHGRRTRGRERQYFKTYKMHHTLAREKDWL